MEVCEIFEQHLSKSAAQTRKQYIEAYGAQYQLNDPAHRVEHFDKVLALMLDLNDHYQLQYRQELIVAGAFLHDLFAAYRDVHHILAQHYVATTDDPLIASLSTSERTLLAAACGEHRASYQGKYSSSFSVLLSSSELSARSLVDSEQVRSKH